MTSKKLICVGNAIVDILVKVEDSFLKLNNLSKGSMSLVNHEEFNNILLNLSQYQIKSGGSAANTAVGYSSFGGQSLFFGSVAKDAFGFSFEKDLNDQGIQFLSCEDDFSNKKTSKSLILVSQDGERTMCTHLDASVSLSLKNFDPSVFGNNNILYLEGYLFDKKETKQAMIDLCKIAQKKNSPICLSLSDSFCVERHREDFFSLIKNYVNILFGNEQEIIALFNGKDTGKVNSIVETAIVTRGSEGANIFKGNNKVFIPPIKGLNVVDTTGAGDLFAAGFLFGFSNKLSLENCGKLATKAASHVIQQYGARPSEQLSSFIVT
ncbi:adenosine kinase [Alphaproteobacteria bacterium]|nr:adenosine kinase [Alphaproteobacteria bacterium]